MKCFLALLLALVVTPAAAQQAAYDNSWVATSTVQGRLSDPAVRSALAAGLPRKLVVLMHGCAGLSGSDGTPSNEYRTVINDLAKRGFMVIAPEQPGHVKSCPGTSFRSRGAVDDIQATRRAELKHALGHVLSEPSVDINHVYVVGQSEGGRLVMEYNAYPTWVKGVVGMGWMCNGGTEIYVNSPVPFLLVWSLHDPKHTKNDGCRARPNGTVSTPDYDHHLPWGNKDAHQQIMAMLSR
jgi:dienelactone hydrolase